MNQGGARQTPPAEEAKPTVPPSEEGQLHYGRQHAQTAELYHQHREEREFTARFSEAQVEPQGGEAPPMEAREEPIIKGKQELPKAPPAEGFGLESLKGMAQQAVSSVRQAAREAARGRPLEGARKLAGDTVSGVLRVAREVSTRRARGARVGGKKGPGKRR